MADKQDEILVHLEYLRRGQDETNDRLRTINGRVGKNENRLTALETRVDDARVAGAKSGGLVAALVAAGHVIWNIVKGGS